MKSSARPFLAWLLGLMCSLVSTHAQTNNWTNAVNSTWTTTSAWSAGLPTSSQDLFLTNGTQTTLNTDGVANSLTVGGSSGTSTLLFSANRSLTVGGDITLASGAGGANLNFGNSNVTLTLNGGAGSIINGGGAGAATLTFGGGFSNSLGLLNASTDELNMGQSGNSTLIITNGQTYNVANLVRLNNSGGAANNATILMNGGTLNHSGSGANQIRFNSGAGAGNTAYLILNSNAVVTATAIRRQNLGADAAIEWNDGTIGNYAGSNLTIDASAGTMNVKLAGTGTHTFDAESGRTITVAATAQLQDKSGEAGTLNKAGGGTLLFLGTNAYTGATTISEGALVISNNIFTATISNNSTRVNFASAPTNGTYTVLSGPLASASLASLVVSGVATNQRGVLSNQTNLVVIVSDISSGPTFATTYPAGSENNVGSNGLQNLINYALGGTGPGASPALPVLTSDGTSLQMTANIRNDGQGVGVVGQVAYSLEGPWTDVGLTPTGASSTVDNTTIKAFSVAIESGQPRKFLRLKATLAP